ncbi:hypothetical protein AHF37_11327 [Paragonimus kellicotti]|nr:hypothetical protein AHF37_11327 [Paragonimus kellicotti]
MSLGFRCALKCDYRIVWPEERFDQAQKIRDAIGYLQRVSRSKVLRRRLQSYSSHIPERCAISFKRVRTYDIHLFQVLYII